MLWGTRRLVNRKETEINYHKTAKFYDEQLEDYNVRCLEKLWFLLFGDKNGKALFDCGLWRVRRRLSIWNSNSDYLWKWLLHLSLLCLVEELLFDCGLFSFALLVGRIWSLCEAMDLQSIINWVLCGVLKMTSNFFSAKKRISNSNK